MTNKSNKLNLNSLIENAKKLRHGPKLWDGYISIQINLRKLIPIRLFTITPVDIENSRKNTNYGEHWNGKQIRVYLQNEIKVWNKSAVSRASSSEPRSDWREGDSAASPWGGKLAYKSTEPGIKIIMKPRHRDKAGWYRLNTPSTPTIARYSNAFSAYIYMKSCVWGLCIRLNRTCF